MSYSYQLYTWLACRRTLSCLYAGEHWLYSAYDWSHRTSLLPFNNASLVMGKLATGPSWKSSLSHWLTFSCLSGFHAVVCGSLWLSYKNVIVHRWCLGAHLSNWHTWSWRISASLPGPYQSTHDSSDDNCHCLCYWWRNDGHSMEAYSSWLVVILCAPPAG